MKDAKVLANTEYIDSLMKKGLSEESALLEIIEDRKKFVESNVFSPAFYCDKVKREDGYILRFTDIKQS